MAHIRQKAVCRTAKASSRSNMHQTIMRQSYMYWHRKNLFFVELILKRSYVIQYLLKFASLSCRSITKIKKHHYQYFFLFWRLEAKKPLLVVTCKLTHINCNKMINLSGQLFDTCGPRYQRLLCDITTTLTVASM